MNDTFVITAYNSGGNFLSGFYVAINSLGIIAKGNEQCERACKTLEFEVKLTRKMLPKLTFFVFATVRGKRTLSQGKIDIEFDRLSENYVSKISLKSQVI